MQYFVGSSLFVAQHYLSVLKHDTSFAVRGGRGVEGTRYKIKCAVLGERHFIGIHCIQIRVKTLSNLNLEE
jgi:hypothetical protein